MANVNFTVVNIGCLSTNKFWGETERIHNVSATSTLLEVDGVRLLVDPSPQPEELEDSLFNTTGLKPAAVDMVYLTHFHGDHRFGIDLFTGKPLLIAEPAFADWSEQNPEEADVRRMFEPSTGQLPKSLTEVAAPGHTYSHHALLCDTQWGKLMVTGDSVMTREFFDAEEGFHNSVDFDAATKSIRMIKQTADFIIPGHGNLIFNGVTRRT
jgi:glyoxylase-like metal-dependent hydrolase (beta-lactamase superfamily II)